MFKTLHLKLLAVYKAKTARWMLRKGYRVLSMSKDDTGEAESQGKVVLVMSKDDNGRAGFQTKEVLFVYKAAKLGQFVQARPNLS